MFGFGQLSREEAERRRERYEPLTEAVRQLIDATVRTEADASTIVAATAEIDSATARLRSQQCDDTLGIFITPEGTTYPWGNVIMGLRNPMAPPLDVQQDGDDRAHADIYIGAPYEGPPGHVHGGYSALVLDHILGAVASHSRPDSVAATGTITYKYRRPTRLGQLHAEAEIQRTEGRKLFVTGHLADAEGATVEADGIFITWNH